MRGMPLARILVLLCLAVPPTAYLCSYQSNTAAQTPQRAVGGQNDDADTARLKKALSDAALRLKSGKEGLRTVYVRNPKSQQGIISGIYVTEAAVQVEAGKEALLLGLDSQNLEALKAHVEKFYPRTRLDVVAIDSRKIHGNIELVAVASEESVAASFAAAERYIAKISAVAAEPVLDLEVKTTEPRATCQLFAGRTKKREVITTDVTKNLARGYYTYTITKEGFKTIQGDLDLVEDDGTVLDCVMYEATDARGPDKCQLK